MIGHDDLKAYFDNARRWEQDLLLSAHRSRRIAWVVAAGACALAVASVGAVAALAPLKTVEPFVIRVDSATGIVDTVSALNSTPARYDEAVTKFFLGRYVRAREGYSYPEAETNFRTISLLSGQGEQARFAAWYRGSNPESPQVVQGRFGVATVRIKAISLLADNVASVRFMKESRKGEETRITHWVSTLTFSYANAPMSSADRLINPLGLSGFGISRRSGGPAMKSFVLLMTFALGFAGPVLALQQPAPGQRDARVRMVTYDPANVVRLNGVIRASTQIVFADDEEIAHVAIGDAVAWEVAPAGSILFLKPREKHAPTNLQVVTTRPDGRKRSYQFELSIAETTLADSYFVVRFAYPGDEIERRRTEAAARGAEREGALIEQTFDLHHAYGARNWRFSAQGSIDLEPEAVFDDGKETTFRFAGNREIPAIYLINSDGSESLVPKDVRGELVVVHATAREFRLAQG